MYGGMIAAICVVVGCAILVAILTPLAIWCWNNELDGFIICATCAALCGLGAIFGGTVGFANASQTVETAISEYNAYVEEYTLVEQLYNDGEDLYQLREDSKVLAVATGGDITGTAAGFINQYIDLDLNATSYYYWAYPTYLDYNYWNNWLKDAQAKKEHSKYSRYYKVPVEELNYIPEEWFLPRE